MSLARFTRNLCWTCVDLFVYIHTQTLGLHYGIFEHWCWLLIFFPFSVFSCPTTTPSAAFRLSCHTCFTSRVSCHMCFMSCVFHSTFFQVACVLHHACFRSHVFHVTLFLVTCVLCHTCYIMCVLLPPTPFKTSFTLFAVLFLVSWPITTANPKYIYIFIYYVIYNGRHT